MAAVLYFLTAVSLLALVHRYFVPLSRREAVMLLLLPLCFTGRALLTNRVYAPLEMPYLAQPLHDHAAELGVGGPHNGRLADIAFQMIPWREATREAYAHRDWPLLNRYAHSGDMLAGAAQPAVFSPFTLIACLLPATISFTYTGSIAFFVAAVGAFLFARELGCSVMASSFAAAGWMMSVPVALMVLWPLGFAWNLLPLILAATHRLVHAPGVRSAAILTTALSLEILAGHPETLLHVSAIGIAYGLFELTQQKERRLAVLVAALASGVVALAITAIQMMTFLDAVWQTSEFGLRRLFGHMPLRVEPGMTKDMLLGDLFPWLRPERWHLPGDAVAGSIIVALALYAAVFVRGRRVWFFVALAVICLFAGTHMWPVAQLLHKVPLFREAFNERLAAAVPFALSMLAAIAIDRLQPRRVAMTCVALLVIYAIAILMHGGVDDVPRLIKDVVPLALVAVALLFAPLPTGEGGSAERDRVRVAIVFALFLVQRISSDGSMIPVHDVRAGYPRLAIFKPMEGVNEPFRIAATGNMFLANTSTMYGLEDVRASTAMNLARLAETFPLWSTVGTKQFHAIPDLAHPILSMMNVRFAFQGTKEAIPIGWHEVARDRSTRLVENERVLPRAFVPRNVTVGASWEEELAGMRDADFADHAWIAAETSPRDRANGGGTATAREGVNRLDIDVNKGGDGYLVISQAAWQGWRAYLDGRRVPIHRANHAFLSVYVPNGQHKVALRFLPHAFVMGRGITFATLAMLTVFGAVWRSTRP